jgi:hypothetical protein
VVTKDNLMESTSKHKDGIDPVRASYGKLSWVRPAGDRPRAYFASGHLSQLILNIPDRNLVMALASGGRLPGGSQKFINELVLPAEAALPASAACLARLD